MKKTAIPWIGSGDEVGSMSPRGDYRDIQFGDYTGSDALVSSKFTHEGETPAAWGDSMASPLKETFMDLEEVQLSALCRILEDMDNSLEEGMVVASYGGAAKKCANMLKTYGLQRDEVVEKRGLSGQDLMFHRFSKKVNSFIYDLRRMEVEGVRVALANLAEQIAFDGGGVFITDPKVDVDDIEKEGFDVVGSPLKNSETSIYYAKNKDLKKSAVARVYNSGSIKASFMCDVAEDSREKVAGLQVYSRLKKECGLLFSYKKATDVMFHMGSVSYPIDIIFVDSDSTIKSIEKNIQPGSLKVFSASGIKNVLEVAGGTCNLLNIRPGEKLYIEKISDSLGAINKTAKFISRHALSGAALKHCDSSVTKEYIVGGKSIVKVAKEGLSANSFVSSPTKAPIDRVAVDVDPFLKSLGSIRLFSHEPARVDKKISRGIYNDTFYADPNIYIDVSAEVLFQKNAYKNLRKSYAFVKNASLTQPFTQDQKKFIFKIAENQKNIIIASRSKRDRELLESFIEDCIHSVSGKKASLRPDYLRLPESYGTKAAYLAASQRFMATDLFSLSLVKEGGMPVPAKVKSHATKIISYIDRASELAADLINNFNKNLEAYKKVDGNDSVIASSKGKYSQSCKRNSRLAKRMLLNVKTNIEMLNKIKDISTTAEVISSMAEASRVSSESIKNIFDLVDVIDAEGFVERLTESTEKAESALSDSILTLNRAKDYINSDILGIVVLTE